MGDVTSLHTGRSVVYGGEPPHDGGMEARVAKLESDMTHVLSALGDIRADGRSHRDGLTAFARDINGEFGKVNGEFGKVRHEMKVDFRLLFGALIAVALGLAGLIAKGFHWL